MTTILHPAPPGATQFAIYEEVGDQEPPSPSDGYEGETSFHSESSLLDADEAIPSIEYDLENGSEPEPYSSSYTSRTPAFESARARRASGMTSTSFISSLPSEISIASKPAAALQINHGFTPLKERPPFRNPSSVRAMQMSSPPPFAAFESPHERLKGSYLATPSRSGRSEPPMSTADSGRPTSRRGARHRMSQEPVLQSPRATPTPQQHLPLVLLHVTILPMQLPYPHDLMVKAMPDWLVENYKLLEEKLNDVVLMRRGLLIPHPNDEYDLLEERILESLELKTPRLLKCGHFVSQSDVEVSDDSEDEASFSDEGLGRGSRMSGGTLTVDEEGDYKPGGSLCEDASVCADCHRHMKKPGKGVGTGTKRWDIKIYAANGLMRAGAWSAAWREMERCDVEITPWIPEEVKKDLENRIKEEHEAQRQKTLYEAEMKRLLEQEQARLKKLEVEADEKRKREEEALQRKMEAEETERQRKLEKEEALRIQLDETMKEKIEEVKEEMRMEFEAQSLAESDAVARRMRALEEELKKFQIAATPPPPTVGDRPIQHEPDTSSPARRRSTPRRREEIALGTALRNYVLLLARDPKNVALIVLTGLVASLAMNASPAQGLAITALDPLTSVAKSYLPSVTTSIVVTDTATLTATSLTTTTVTHVEYHRIEVKPTPSLLHEDVIPIVEYPNVVETEVTSSVSPSATQEISGAIGTTSPKSAGASVSDAQPDLLSDAAISTSDETKFESTEPESSGTLSQAAAEDPSEEINNGNAAPVESASILSASDPALAPAPSSSALASPESSSTSTLISSTAPDPQPAVSETTSKVLLEEATRPSETQRQSAICSLESDTKHLSFPSLICDARAAPTNLTSNNPAYSPFMCLRES